MTEPETNTAATHVSDREAAYLQHLHKRFEETQKALQTAMNEYASYLVGLYVIDPQKGDRLNPDGSITRGAPPAA